MLMARRAGEGESEALARALVGGLADLGWHESDNLRIDWRWAGDDSRLLDSDAAELTALQPGVVLAAGTVASQSLRRRSDKIPIVFVHVTDPVGQGLVKSLARPGGNITGFSIYDPPMAGKWLELLTRIKPRPIDVAILFNPLTTPYAGLYLQALRDISPRAAITVRPAACNNDAEIDTVMKRLGQGRGGLLVLPNAFSQEHRDTIVSLAAKYRVPVVYPELTFPAAGGLLSYGVNLPDLYRRAAGYVDRILKGAKPGDLPVQNPTKFELVVNLKTAREIGITIAPSLLAQADEVIE